MKSGARYLFRDSEDVKRFGAGMLQFVARSVAERGAQWVQVDDYRDPRSLSQNALQHVWYADIEKAGIMTKREARRYCKLHFGVPILRSSEHEEGMRFREAWDSMIKTRFTYEEKCKMMDFMPVTSLMSAAEMTDYLDAMQRHFAHQGVQLVSRYDQHA